VKEKRSKGGIMAESNGSLVLQFDELSRNSNVLQTSDDEQFLRFVLNAGLNRRRWENAELECQRLGIELTKAAQEIGGLEHKLSHARTMLDNELLLRKKAEGERDRLSSQISLLRQLVMDDKLVDEVKLNKLRNIGTMDFTSDDASSPCPATPKGILKKFNLTEDSVRDVEDFSFDDTRDLFDSYSRIENRTSTRKRSRSRGRDTIGENILENIASPRSENFQSRKRTRRSRSMVGFEETREVPVNEEPEPRPRSNSLFDKSEAPKTVSSSPISGHTLTHKTIMKKEKCVVCDQRIKFGKIVYKCGTCRIVFHTECTNRAPRCTRSGSPEICRTPLAERNRSPMKKPYFASPMLR
jgi:hypothetical protein